jgi:hypothetical protein
VRLPERVAWDERLPELLRRTVGVPIDVELSATGIGPVGSS